MRCIRNFEEGERRPMGQSDFDRHLADALVSLELLAEALKLPDGTRILDVFQTPDNRMNGTVTLRLEHDSLPCVERGQVVPAVNVMYEHTHCHYDTGNG